MSSVDIDRFCPTPGDHPFWNESVWFSFSVPERGIHGMVYYFFRPNMNWFVGGPVVWDASGAHVEDCLYYDWHHMQTMPSAAQKFDFHSRNSLTVSVVEPRKKYRLGYDDNGFKLDLIWSALSEPHHIDTMEVSSTGVPNHNRMHMEQVGRVAGQICLAGENIDVDCYAIRDTSWGVRDFDGVRRGSYFWAIADATTAFHVMTMGDESDQEVVGGFLMLDGKCATVKSGRRFNTRMGRLTPDAFDLVLEDELGRTASLSAAISSHLLFNGYPRMQTVWSLLEATFDNGKRGWGDIQEFQPLERFRAMIRGKAAGGKAQ